MIISTRINEIMEPTELLKHLLAYAKIDFIMSPNPDDSWLRVYRYDKDWVKDGHFFSIDNSSGDHIHILFSSFGCIIKGFDHESEICANNKRRGVSHSDCIAAHDFYKDAPVELVSLVDDPALQKEQVTFCAWRTIDDAAWHYAPFAVPEDWHDGIDLFLYYAHNLKQHQEWFEENYELALDTKILLSIYDGSTITSIIVNSLNPDVTLETISEGFSDIFAVSPLRPGVWGAKPHDVPFCPS